MSRSVHFLLFALLVWGCARKEPPTGDPEARVVEYLNKTVSPGKPVLVTELYNDVFTTPEEQKAVKRLYDALFQLPAFVARTYVESGKIPTKDEIAAHFQFQVPGTTEALLRVLESDPRVPPFFERNSAGEITAVDVDAIRNADRFGPPLQDGK
jgi:hypothetical protein